MLKLSKNSQENTCVGVSFYIKLLASGLQFYLKKRDVGCFPVKYAKIFKNIFFSRTAPVTAPDVISVFPGTLDQLIQGKKWLEKG